MEVVVITEIEITRGVAGVNENLRDVIPRLMRIVTKLMIHTLTPTVKMIITTTIPCTLTTQIQTRQKMSIDQNVLTLIIVIHEGAANRSIVVDTTEMIGAGKRREIHIRMIRIDIEIGITAIVVAKDIGIHIEIEIWRTEREIESMENVIGTEAGAPPYLHADHIIEKMSTGTEDTSVLALVRPLLLTCNLLHPFHTILLSKKVEAIVVTHIEGIQDTVHHNSARMQETEKRGDQLQHQVEIHLGGKQ